jgi:hypothetical protein
MKMFGSDMECRNRAAARSGPVAARSGEKRSVIPPFRAIHLMVNISRTAKSGNDWSQAELRAYNISVEFQDATTFLASPLYPDQTSLMNS